MLRQLFLGLFIATITYILAPPKQFNSRLDKIDEKTVKIDNLYYGLSNFAPTWWKSDSWAQGLHALNPTRTTYILDLLKKKKISKTSSIFDVGCGGGLITKVISSNGYINVIGMDISPKSLEAAKEIDKLSKYFVGSIYKVPMEDNSVDVIIISDVMAHLFDLRTAFSEITRILKPKGLIIFESITRTFWSNLTIKIFGETFGFIPKDTHDFRMFVSPEDLKELGKEFNFEVKTWSGIQISLGFNNNYKLYVKSSYLLDEYQVRDTFIGYAEKK